MTATSRLEQILRRDRLLVLLALAAVVVLAAAYTVAGIGMDMSALTMTRMAIEMPGMMMQPAQWSAGYAAVMFLMWWVMMIAMMVPSATPAILLYASVARKQPNHPAPFLATFIFLSGYLVAWAFFSLVATALQWALEKAGIITGMMEIGAPVFAGSILMAAGLYQLTPLKQACLRHCQHPVLFVMHHWRPGRTGAFEMGLRHGVHCLGCCWLLMALLFVGGVMNLLWIAGIAIYVGVEKLAGRWRLLPDVAALVLAGSGLWLIAGAIVGPQG
jgi:predicted metal-binding membrane protein